MSVTVVTALKAIDDIQARLDNLLDLLQRSETQNARLAAELKQAHAEIAQLENQRDTWRARSGQ